MISDSITYLYAVGVVSYLVFELPPPEYPGPSLPAVDADGVGDAASAGGVDGVGQGVLVAGLLQIVAAPQWRDEIWEEGEQVVLLYCTVERVPPLFCRLKHIEAE